MKVLDDLLGIWPSHAELARDIDKSPKHISAIVQRQSVPTRFWTPIIKAAERRAKEARKAGDEKLAEKFDLVTAESLLNLQNALDRARGS